LRAEQTIRFAANALYVASTTLGHEIVDGKQGVFGGKCNSLQRVARARPTRRQMTGVHARAKMLLAEHG
jgi:hypothetical protein